MKCNSAVNTKWFFHKYGDIRKACIVEDSTVNFFLRAAHREHHEGYYFCYGFDGDSNKHFISKAKVYVYGKT